MKIDSHIKVQADALEKLKKEYGEKKFNMVFNEIKANTQLDNMGHIILMIGNTLATRYGIPNQKIKNKLKC